MNPVLQFESSAHRIWSSNLTPLDKAERLLQLSQAVDRYVARLDENRSRIVTTGDAWGGATFDRVKSYLETLAADTRRMCKECQGDMAAR